MRIVLLSRRSRSYSTERLLESARARGHTCRAIDPDECALVLDGGAPVVYFKSRRLRNVGLAIPRLGVHSTEFALSILQALDALRVPCLNGPDAISRARDKFRNLSVLALAGVPVPRTLVCRRPEEIGRKMLLIGGPPVLLKVQGTHGGPILAENLDSAVSIVESFWAEGKNILLQQVAPRGGREVRAFVVGGRVIAAVRRAAPREPPRGSRRRARAPGARAEEPAPAPEAAELARPHRALAIRAAEVLGLDVAGVDLHEGRAPLVMEVNPAPALEDMERATEIDVAGEVLKFAEGFAAARSGRTEILVPGA